MAQAGGTLPNFLVVGAARAGTTSLCHYLGQHPDILFCPVKEPGFISGQFTTGMVNAADRPRFTGLAEYRALYAAHAGERAVGEGSVENLYYHAGAIPQIRRHFGDPAIIIILRHPAERAYSHYCFQKISGRETLSFTEALAQEESRRRAGWYYAWHYTAVSMYAQQVRAYRENFARVHIALYEELDREPDPLLRRLFAFLEVDAAFTPDLDIRFNSSRSPVIERAMFTRTGGTTGKFNGLTGAGWQRLQARRQAEAAPAPVMPAEIRAGAGHAGGNPRAALRPVPRRCAAPAGRPRPRPSALADLIRPRRHFRRRRHIDWRATLKYALCQGEEYA